MSSILIVDDEKGVRFVVRKILEAEGYQVTEARSGRNCLKKLEKETPDLILLDIMMPGMSGWETLKEIKNDPDLTGIPVAMLTVKKISADTMKKEEIGGLVDYITKPFSKEGLTESIRKILETSSEIESKKPILQKIKPKLAEEYKETKEALALHRNLIENLLELMADYLDDSLWKDKTEIEEAIEKEQDLVDSLEKKVKELEDLLTSGS